MRFPSKQVVEKNKERYPNGCRVELVRMNDPYSNLKPGTKGTVAFVDDTGTIFVDWDTGSGLGIIYGEDLCRKIEED